LPFLHGFLFVIPSEKKENIPVDLRKPWSNGQRKNKQKTILRFLYSAVFSDVNPRKAVVGLQNSDKLGVPVESAVGGHYGVNSVSHFQLFQCPDHVRTLVQGC
jgi:hypothetical protein